MTSTQWILDSIDVLNEYLWTYVVIVMLVGCAIYFTVRSKGVQFRLLKDMVKIIIDRPIYNNKVEGKAQASGNDERLKKIGSFQAFAVSLSSRVGTGNLAGVASAIFMGGPGAVFWLWRCLVLPRLSLSQLSPSSTSGVARTRFMAVRHTIWSMGFTADGWVCCLRC